MAETQAEAAIMAKTAQEFDNASQSLGVMLTRLMGELAGLETAWRGLAGTAFTRVKQNFEASQQKMQQALSETATAIRTSGQSYTTTDDAAAGRVNATNRNVELPL